MRYVHYNSSFTYPYPECIEYTTIQLLTVAPGV
jgi:hypothetical protein